MFAMLRLQIPIYGVILGSSNVCEYDRSFSYVERVSKKQKQKVRGWMFSIFAELDVDVSSL